MSAKQKEQVILAVEELGRSVSVAQVAKTTGLNSNIVFRYLREVAAGTGSNLQVLGDGEIFYVFPPNFIDLFQRKDRAIWLDESLRVAFDVSFFALRILFALSLLVVVYIFHPLDPFLFIIYLVIIFGGLYFELNGVDVDGELNIKVHVGEHKQSTKKALGLAGLARLFSFKYRERRHDLKNILAHLSDQEPPSQAHPSAFNICFSYVFGDGNPNVQFEELKWQVLAEVIRQHNGAVILDQLAPYMCCAPDDDESILPVLQRFNGFPRATEGGNLVYLFPDLMKVEKADIYIPPALSENTWRFSDLPFPQIFPVWILSTALVIFSYFGYFHADPTAAVNSGSILLWQFLFPFSVFFFVAPGLRFMFITLNNAEIEERNKLRRYFGQLLDKPDPELFQKLLERNEYELDEMLIQSQTETVVYTTQKTLDEQGLDVY